MKFFLALALATFACCSSIGYGKTNQNESQILINTTNKLENINQAIKQPGRLGKIIPFDYPNSNVDALIGWGYTRLFDAVQRNELETVDFLLNLGANPNIAVDDVGVEIVTPLLSATRRGFTDIVLRLMQDPRTDIKVRSIDGERCMARGNFTLLHYGALTARHELLEVVIPQLQKRMTSQEFAEFLNVEAEIYPIVKPTNEAELAKYGKTAFDLAHFYYVDYSKALETMQRLFYSNKEIMSAEQLKLLAKEIEELQMQIQAYQKTVQVLGRVTYQVNTNN